MKMDDEAKRLVRIGIFTNVPKSRTQDEDEEFIPNVGSLVILAQLDLQF